MKQRIVKEATDFDINKLSIKQISNKETQILSSDKFIPSQILKSKFNKKRYHSIQDLYENIVFHAASEFKYPTAPNQIEI